MHIERMVHKPLIAWDLGFSCMISQRSLPLNNVRTALGLIVNKLYCVGGGHLHFCASWRKIETGATEVKKMPTI
jgi:hypothetical protein